MKVSYASPIEILWLIAAIIGWVFALRSKFDSRDDRTRWENSKIEAQRFMTRIIHISARLMFITHTVNVIMALWAVTHGPPPPPLWRVQGFFLVIGNITITILLMIIGGLSRKWRHRIERGFAARADARSTAQHIGRRDTDPLPLSGSLDEPKEK
jgi:hypothetical protein